MVFSFLQLVIIGSGVADIVALLLVTAPFVVYIFYCTQPSLAAIVGSTVGIDCASAAVVLAAVGQVYVIGA